MTGQPQFKSQQPQPQAQAQAESHSSPHPPAATPVKSRPKTGPIVWGTLVLVFCAYVASVEMGNAIDPTTWIIATLIGLGVLLLAVGAVIILRSGSERS